MDRINASSFMGKNIKKIWSIEKYMTRVLQKNQFMSALSILSMSPFFSQILFWTDDVCTILGQAIKLETGHLCLRWESKAKESLHGVGQRQAGLTSEKAES